MAGGFGAGFDESAAAEVFSAREAGEDDVDGVEWGETLGGTADAADDAGAEGCVEGDGDAVEEDAVEATMGVGADS